MRRGPFIVKIKNFIHDNEKKHVSFDVEIRGITNSVEIEATSYGCTSTNIDEFTSSWSEAEYDQLDEFSTGCQHLVHKFNHWD